MREELSKSAKYMTNHPTHMNMTIASMQEAVEYWLSEKVFRENIEIESVSFNEKDHFTIKIKREQA